MGVGRADFAPDLVPDFVVELDGFRVANARADKIGLVAPMTKPRLVEKKLGTALFAVEGGALNPQLVRFHRFGEGFDLYFESGFAFLGPRAVLGKASPPPPISFISSASATRSPHCC